MIRHLILCNCIVFMVLASFIASADHVLFVTEDLPPLQVSQRDEKPTGAMVELVEEIIKETKLNASIISLPWARSYNMALNTKNVFIFSILRSDDREKLFQWVGQIYTIRAYLAALSSNNEININNIKQARDYRVGVIRHAPAMNYLIGNGFVEQKNIYISNSYPSLWNNLFKGNTDLTFTNNIIWQPQLEKAGFDANDIKLVTEVEGFATEMYLAASVKTNKKLINMTRAALEKIKADGRYDKILKKWQLM